MDTTLTDAIGSGERDDILGIREDISLGRVAAAVATVHSTDPDEDEMVVVDEFTQEPLTVAQAVAEIDRLLAAS
jgi:hypothetical protein